MPARKTVDPNQPALFSVEEYLRTAPCVPLLRQKVGEWREAGYPGATGVTRDLLRFWFYSDHRLHDGRPFAYHRSQQEAIETLIYCYEVARVRTPQALIEKFARGGELRLTGMVDWARYATKMATGSGKTKVMSLAVVWHYFNAVQGANDDEYARTFLIVAPNVIVFERLKSDFANGKIFGNDPLMPDYLRAIGWDVDCVMRGEGERAHAEGALFLTNVQQLYDRPAGKKNDQESEPLAAVLGPRPPADLSAAPSFAERIAARGGKLLVINDEAHHTHDEDSEWMSVVKGLHAATPIAGQLDFSATPRFQKGGLFPWVVSDYPLKQAIVDGVVKRPYKGVANITEVSSDDAAVRYAGFLHAAFERWREYRDQLAPIERRPLLFVMMNSTGEADDVGDHLRAKYPDELGGDKTLVIHTKNNGEITERELESARRIAHDVDGPQSRVSAIVSVLMLREGWDVQNVTVVVGLRPYSSKANILPEQTIGRGLRLMFRGDNPGYTERVDIIGNKPFLAFVDDLDKLEDVKLDEFEVGKDKLHILTIAPVPEKAHYDIGIPLISPALQRKKTLRDEIDALDVSAFACPPLPLREGDTAERTFRYEGKDIITLATEIERDYTIPPIKTSGEIIGYYARLIAKDLKLPSQFAALVPKAREFFATRAFGAPVNVDDETVIQAMSRPVVSYIVRKVFAAALRDLILEPLTPELAGDARWLREIEPFLFSNPNALEARRCVLNYAPCTNKFERDFGQWLDEASDVTAWCKVPERFGFAIEYTDPSASLRYYYPDFVAVTAEGRHWVIETKGAETIEVAAKDRAARLWCENATALTGTQWGYVKVAQRDFESTQLADFADLTLL